VPSRSARAGASGGSFACSSGRTSCARAS
jgi:hypothetical protein